MQQAMRCDETSDLARTVPQHLAGSSPAARCSRSQSVLKTRDERCNVFWVLRAVVPSSGAAHSGPTQQGRLGEK